MNNGITLARLRPPIIRIHSLVKYTQFEQLGIQSLWIKTSLSFGRLASWILEVCEGAKDSSRPVQCTRETP